jgi:hypothetical protein
MTASWPGLRVYYHDEPDPLILDAVRPVLAGAPGAFFVRHWLGGPHLRLCFPGPAFARVDPAAVKALRAWLLDHPSQARLDPARLRYDQDLLAAREAMAEPVPPPAPDNSVELVAYDRRLTELGGVEAADLMEDFYAGTNAAVYAGLEAVRAGGSRTATALDLLWAVTHTHGAAVTHPFVSLRTHAEVFLAAAHDPVGCRELFAGQFRARRQALAERLDGLVGGAAWPADVAIVLDRLTAAGPRVAELTGAGQVNLWATPPPPPGRTEFLDELESGRLLSTLGASPEFAIWRVTINLLYLHLTRLGISPFQRALLAYLAAATLEERLGVRATDVIW